MSRYTPVFEPLIPKVGILPTLVFGLIWRYSHLADNVCRASMQTLADRLGLCRMTVIRSVKTLRQAGLIEDLSPYIHTQPHRLRPSQQALDLLNKESDSPDITHSYNNSLNQVKEITKGDSTSNFQLQRNVTLSDTNHTSLRNNEETILLTPDQKSYYQSRVEYTNQNLLTFNRCKPIKHFRFETIKENSLVISHPDSHFLSKLGPEFYRLYEKTLAMYLPEEEKKVVFVLREVIKS
jgi:DNA-binding Lrp family transcriptional regulator